MLCRAGKKLLPHRSLVEEQLLLHCAVRSNRHAHYQSPLMNHSLAPTHPPIYSENLERPIGSTAHTPCQLSFSSLLPIILKTELSKAGTPLGTAKVDCRSCILSLIELYTHWLSQPMDLLLLYHTLSSIVMLSDLFVLSSQYEWMMLTFLDLLDTHPPEDTLSEAILVFGVLKAAAILRVVSFNPSRRGYFTVW